MTKISSHQHVIAHSRAGREDVVCLIAVGEGGMFLSLHTGLLLPAHRGHQQAVPDRGEEVTAVRFDDLTCPRNTLPPSQGPKRKKPQHSRAAGLPGSLATERPNVGVRRDVPPRPRAPASHISA